MKNFQVRLADDLHTAGAESARARGITFTELIRQAVELYLHLSVLIREGATLYCERADGTRVEFPIPGISRKFK